MSPLAELVRESLRPLPVAPTGLSPKLPRLDGIRAVVFDLSGTLLVSAAGGEPVHDDGATGNPPGFEAAFWDSVRARQERKRAAGIAHPEVDIREVWADVLARLGEPGPEAAVLEERALRHECHLNPAWPMPNAEFILDALRESGFLLGIISNAQFYTLPVMEGLFGRDFDGLGFHPRLRVFSFEVGEGKPSPRLFARLLEEAFALGVAPEEILYVGNDFHKDILRGRAAGFRTALFAGDLRSLRLGGVPVEEAVATADAVLTDLAQIRDVLEG
jgi:putative hydrolase of the HAD superfamily